LYYNIRELLKTIKLSSWSIILNKKFRIVHKLNTSFHLIDLPENFKLHRFFGFVRDTSTVFGVARWLNGFWYLSSFAIARSRISLTVAVWLCKKTPGKFFTPL